ncbi:MAG: hypothetical protein RMN25_14505 [Anaerolineae bacterium]|nr:hypothetical protein [Thermoflexales bacterium]MDW8408982.1 hypothetical protein [Anaerolineae bacterium]
MVSVAPEAILHTEREVDLFRFGWRSVRCELPGGEEETEACAQIKPEARAAAEARRRDLEHELARLRAQRDAG